MVKKLKLKDPKYRVKYLKKLNIKARKYKSELERLTKILDIINFSDVPVENKKSVKDLDLKSLKHLRNLAIRGVKCHSELKRIRKILDRYTLKISVSYTSMQ